MSLIDTCNLLLINLHRCLDEAVKAVYGFAPLPVAGSLADRAASLKATFDANSHAFVATPTHLAALNSLLAEYRQQAFLINTTTITVEATRLIAWNDVINKPVKFPPTEHTHPAQPIAWDAVQNKPATFPPDEHTHPAQSIAWDAVQNKPATFPPDEHAHDLLRIGGMLLRYNSGGYLEQSLNDGATWTPLVSSAPPAATAYALAWAASATEQLTRTIAGAWFNGDLQLWMRVYVDAASYGTYLLTAANIISVSVGYAGALGIEYMNRYGDYETVEDARTGITGWHDIGLQWTLATGSAIIYLDGVGGSALSVSKDALDEAAQYALFVGGARNKIAALTWSHALTWTPTAASADTMTDIIFDLPLTEGSGATTTDSTGTAWTIPSGVTWETL